MGVLNKPSCPMRACVHVGTMFSGRRAVQTERRGITTARGRDAEAGDGGRRQAAGGNGHPGERMLVVERES